MDKVLPAVAALGHLHRRMLAVGAAAVLMAFSAAGALVAALLLALLVAWLWCSRRHGGMAALASEAKRLGRRLASPGLLLAERLADLLGLPAAALAAGRAAELEPRPAPALPAAGVTLTPRLLPLPARARA